VLTISDLCKPPKYATRTIGVGCLDDTGSAARFLA
jgi:hypothetical protein